MNFKVVTLQNPNPGLEMAWWFRPNDLRCWNLKGADFEIHNLVLFFTVLGTYWELEARIGTVRKLSFSTFRLNKHFSFLMKNFGWKTRKTNRPLPQNTTLSECDVATLDRIHSGIARDVSKLLTYDKIPKNHISKTPWTLAPAILVGIGCIFGSPAYEKICADMTRSWTRF